MPNAYITDADYLWYYADGTGRYAGFFSPTQTHKMKIIMIPKYTLFFFYHAQKFMQIILKLHSPASKPNIYSFAPISECQRNSYDQMNMVEIDLLQEFWN